MKPRSHPGGFTAAEMLVATSIAAVVIGMAAITIYAIVGAQRQYTSVATVTVPNGALANFYSGLTGTSINAAVAPSYSAVGRAESMREKFVMDVQQAVGVYCLARNVGTYNAIRPSSITAPPYGTVLDTPEAFRTYLGVLYPAATTTFVSFRNFPASAPCFSIYILGYSSGSSAIPVNAVYDLDIVTATDPNNASVTFGNYVSVRRYVNGALTAYYDCIFRLSGDGTDSWSPPVVSFERQVRKALTEGATTTDRFKVAEEKPFYFVFWPDPAADSLRLPAGNTLGSVNPTFATTDPRKAYNHMAGRTSFMFVVPLFPSS